MASSIKTLRRSTLHRPSEGGASRPATHGPCSFREFASHTILFVGTHWSSLSTHQGANAAFIVAFDESIWTRLEQILGCCGPPFFDIAIRYSCVSLGASGSGIARSGCGDETQRSETVDQSISHSAVPVQTSQKAGSGECGRCLAGSSRTSARSGAGAPQPRRIARLEGRLGNWRRRSPNPSGTSLFTKSWSRSLTMRCNRKVLHRERTVWGRAPAPDGLRALELQGNTDSVVPWAYPLKEFALPESRHGSDS